MKIDIYITAPTQRDINTARTKSCTVGAAVVLGAGTPYMLHYLWGCSPAELNAWFASGAFVVTTLSLILAVLIMLYAASTGYAPINGHAAGMVVSWSKSNPAVATYVAQVRMQKREIINKEYSALEAYYKEQLHAANKAALYGKQ